MARETIHVYCVPTMWMAILIVLLKSPSEARPNDHAQQTGPVSDLSPESAAFQMLLSAHSLEAVNVNRRQITTTTIGDETPTTTNDELDDTTLPDTTTTIEADTTITAKTNQPTRSTEKPTTVTIIKPSKITSTSRPITKSTKPTHTITARPYTASNSPTTTGDPANVTPDDTLQQVGPVDIPAQPVETPHPYHGHPTKSVHPPTPILISAEETDDDPFDISQILSRKPIVVVLENSENPSDEAQDPIVPETRPQSNIMRAAKRKKILTQPLSIDNDVIRILPESSDPRRDEDCVEKKTYRILPAQDNECLDENELIKSTLDDDCAPDGDDEELANEDSDEVIAWNRYLANWLFFNSRFWFGD